MLSARDRRADSRDEIWSESSNYARERHGQSEGGGTQSASVCAGLSVCMCGRIYSAKLNIVLINLGTGACVLKATPFHLGYV